MSRPLISALLALGLGACADLGAPLSPPPVHPNGQALWRIVHDQCAPDQRARHDPSPCALVSIEDGEARGFAVLKDRAGVAQYLLMPTAKITGIEDPAILQPGAVNYFARAWDARGLVEDRLGRELARTRLSIAVNSIYGRSQDQLHLHIDCLDGAVGAALRDSEAPASGGWAGRTIVLKGHRYRVRWLDADKLGAENPFQLLAQDIPGARKAMGAWTLALVGAEGPNGAPGFLLLADRADPAAGDRGSAEELQDHDCR
jgi:CDP-diacylglycerol pyrophosphatase